MRNTKLLVLPIGLMLGLLTTGFAFACWSETLYINGSIATGELDMEILSASADDSMEGKDVASTEVELLDTDKDDDMDKIHITITNAYPCYEVYIHFTAHNNGTIPAHFKGFYPQPPFEKVGKEWHAELFEGDITIQGWNSYCEQIHPGEKADYTIWIHVEQQADELRDYDFEIWACFVQYNCDDE